MNHEERLRRLRIRRGIADARTTIGIIAKERVREHQIHRLAASKVRTLSAALAQGRTPRDRLAALERFLGPEGVSKREREGSGWLDRVSRHETRLDAVCRDINGLRERARSIVERVRESEAMTSLVEQQLVAYYVYVLEMWATLEPVRRGERRYA